jgi:hypothetical protein
MTIIAEAKYQVLGFEQLELSTTPKSLAVPNGAAYAKIRANLFDSRWRDDGTDPTNTVGHILYEGKTITYIGDLRKMRFVSIPGTSYVSITYYIIIG